MHIKLGASYLQALEKFVKNNRQNVLNTKKAVRLFENNPNYPSLHLEKLSGTKIWTIRIDKGNRIFLYFQGKDTALFIDIGKHDKYRKH